MKVKPLLPLTVPYPIVFCWLAMIVGSCFEFRQWVPNVRDTDFPTYFAASYMARNGMSAQIYDYANDHVDPTEDAPKDNSDFAHALRSLGLSQTGLYDYPPTLADLLIPLTYLSAESAMQLWRILNFVGLAVTCGLLARMMGSSRKRDFWLILALMCIFRPTLYCFDWGNVTVLLLILLVCGYSLYTRGNYAWSGLMFGLAIALKLTPLIVIIPFLIWREWRMLRAICLWVVVLLLSLVSINGLDTLRFYFLSVVPKMAHNGIVADDRSLTTLVQAFCRLLVPSAPHSSVILAARILTLFLLILAAWYTGRHGDTQRETGQRTETLFVFLLLSCCLSPIAWLYAYVLAAPALLIVVRRIWNGETNQFETLLTVSLMALLSLDPGTLTSLANHLHLTTTLRFCVTAIPMIGIVLAMLTLARSPVGTGTRRALVH